MSQRERDVLKVMSLVLKGQRTQVEAARLLKLGVRQIRRIAVRLKKEGDGAVVHRLRGKPSNRRIDLAVRKQALSLYRQKYPGFGPTLAAEKLAGPAQGGSHCGKAFGWLDEDPLQEALSGIPAD